MRLDINLASHPYEDAKEFWQQWGAALAVMGVVTLFLVGFTVWKWNKASKDRAEVRSLEHNIAVLDGKLAKSQATLNLPENRTLREQSSYLNNLFQQKASWTKIFEDLERVMPPRLHVVSIHPEVDANNQLGIKLSVAGESHERALDLVRKMEESRNFQQTHILDEDGGSPPDAVKLNISTLYIPGDKAVKQGAAH